MTKKEEAELKRAARLEAERERISSMKSFERQVLSEHNAGKNGSSGFLICGIDEAGRGPFAGPVVAGAVILDTEDPEKEILYLNDSKKLSEKKREMLYEEIMQKAVAVGIGYSGAGTIDRINILQATYAAMRQAAANLTDVSFLYSADASVHELVSRLVRYELPQSTSKSSGSSQITEEHAAHLHIVPDYILADAVHIPGIDIPQMGIVKGDAKSVSIAAGSIIAKVTRDHIMYEYDRIYPGYGFASHKGYGTSAHIAAIKEHGMTDIHRRSFIHF